MKKKIGAFGAGQFSLGTLVEGQPGTTIFQNPGAGGGVAYKDPARLPPRDSVYSETEAGETTPTVVPPHLRPYFHEVWGEEGVFGAHEVHSGVGVGGRHR